MPVFPGGPSGPCKEQIQVIFFPASQKNQTVAASQMLTTCILLLQQWAFLNKVLQMLKIINDRKKKICFVFTFCKIFFVSTDKMLMQVEQFWCVQFESRTLRMEGKNKSISKETNTWNPKFQECWTIVQVLTFSPAGPSSPTMPSGPLGPSRKEKKNFYLNIVRKMTTFTFAGNWSESNLSSFWTPPWNRTLETDFLFFLQFCPY